MAYSSALFALARSKLNKTYLYNRYYKQQIALSTYPLVPKLNTSYKCRITSKSQHHCHPSDTASDRHRVTWWQKLRSSPDATTLNIKKVYFPQISQTASGDLIKYNNRHRLLFVHLFCLIWG